MPVEFINSQAFWIMLSVPLLLWALLWGIRRRRALLREFGRAELLAQFSKISLSRKTAYRVVPGVLCIALLVGVIARPFVSGNSGRIAKGTLDVVAVLDVSKSMGAEDCGPQISRIKLAKETILKCLPALRGNRLGLVTFAGKSFPQAELTDDFHALRFVIEKWVTVDSAPAQGSNIGEALSEAVNLFEEEEKKKVVLLFSDGGHQSQEDLDLVLNDLNTKQITVVSVGIGTIEGSKVPVYKDGEFKEWLKIKDEEAVTRLNEEILDRVSRDTGGKYIHVTSGDRLKGIFKDPGIVGKKALAGGKEIFQIPLALAIGLAFAGIYLERRTSQ
jgi:Ca-activated chloride channel family protein